MAFLEAYPSDWTLIINWFACTAEAHIKVGGLFSADELIIAACRNTSVPAARLENGGDSWFIQYAGAWVQPLLRQSLQPQVWQEDRVSALSYAVVQFMVANTCGLGPWMAELLRLRSLFNLHDTGVQVTAEVAAGLFEQYISGLERRGYHGCIKALTMFMWSTMVAVAHLQTTHDGAVPFLSSIDAAAWIAFKHCPGIDLAWVHALASLGGYLREWNQMFGTVIHQGTHLWHLCKEWQSQLVHEMFQSSQPGVGGAIVEASDASISSNSHAPNAGLIAACPWEHLNPLNPHSYRVYVECESCHAEVLTEYGLGGEPYNFLHALGWSKVGKRWEKAKCGRCRREGR